MLDLALVDRQHILVGSTTSFLCSQVYAAPNYVLQEFEGRAGKLFTKYVVVEMLAFASFDGAWDWCFVVAQDVLHNMLLQTIVIDKVTINTATKYAKLHGSGAKTTLV